MTLSAIFYPYHFSVPFCPCHFVQYHFVRIPFCPYHFVCTILSATILSGHLFTSIVHAFVCSRIDYCNSLLTGLPKTWLSPLQTERSCTTHCQTSPLLPYLLLHQGTSPLASNLSPCAVNSSSSSDCLDHPSPMFSFCRHIS